MARFWYPSNIAIQAGIDYEDFDENDLDDMPAEWVAAITSMMEMFIDAEDGFTGTVKARLEQV